MNIEVFLLKSCLDEEGVALKLREDGDVLMRMTLRNQLALWVTVHG